jgi:endonuclease/exonuclease/phosphatase family metal-dependent hydrolase
VQDRAKPWEDITTPKFAFKIPMVVIGDFNETLHAYERSSGYFNHSGSALLRNFLSDCDLIEFKLQSHCFTWFREGSMSRIDRAFTSIKFHFQFPFFSLYRYLIGMSDHSQLLLQTSKVH